MAGQGDQLARGAGGGQLVGGLDAEEPDQPVGQRVQRDDDGPQQGGEAGLRSGDEAGDLERPGDRPVLGDEFADDHLDGGGEEHPDDDADAGDRARGQSGGGEGTGEQLGECRFGEHPDDQRGDGDAELGAGELEGEFAQGFDDGTGPPVALGGSAFGVGPVHGDEPEFGCHEESVGEDEEEGRREEQQGGGHEAAASGEGAAQVLPDDPSIAGGSHSLGRRKAPRAPGGEPWNGRGGAHGAPPSTRVDNAAVCGAGAPPVRGCRRPWRTGTRRGRAGSGRRGWPAPWPCRAGCRGRACWCRR
ncbi:hypothetical protein SMICM304S_02854 [Streptomyces microflavus]